MLSGDLICEDDINGMVGRSREAYDFIKKIFVEGSFHFSQINHSDEHWEMGQLIKCSSKF